MKRSIGILIGFFVFIVILGLCINLFPEEIVVRLIATIAFLALVISFSDYLIIFLNWKTIASIVSGLGIVFAFLVFFLAPMFNTTEDLNEWANMLTIWGIGLVFFNLIASDFITKKVK